MMIKEGDIIINADEVTENLPDGLIMEKDLRVFSCQGELSAVAFIRKNGSRRLAKDDSKKAVKVLEDLTGYEYSVDNVSNFVIHLEDKQS